MDYRHLKFVILSLTTSISLLGPHHSFADEPLAKTEKPRLEKQFVIQDARSLFEQLKLSDVKQSGNKLMNLPLGLHQLKQRSDELNKSSNPQNSKNLSKSRQSHNFNEEKRSIKLLVHGFGSRGYEWIYAIKQFASVSDVFFLRWDWSQCPQQGAQILSQYINTLQERYPKAPIEVFGHSYGGVITAISAANYIGEKPLTMNIIASPVAGHPRLEDRCTQTIKVLTENLNQIKKSFNSALSLYQWRTRKELDGAFKDMDHNPQLVNWHGEVIQLPTNYKGHRLGHNWSISWVTDQTLKQKK